MTKRSRVANLSERYELADLEPDVDPQKAAAFLEGHSTKSQPSSSEHERKSKQSDTQSRAVVATITKPKPAYAKRPEPWTSRTIRLRQSTATALTKAACSQKSKLVEAKLQSGQPVTVQEIADWGIRLALDKLGYISD